MESNTHTTNEAEPLYPSALDLLYPDQELPELEMEVEIDPVMAAELNIDEVEILDEELDGTEEQFNLELDYYDVEKQEEKLWQARTGLNRETLCGAIETVIFMSDKPVALAKIKSLIDEDMPLRVIHESIERLQEEYEAKHHGLRLVEVADGYQYRTKATYSKYVQDLFKVNSLVLSPTALEVLAIIAYKQPVSKMEIEKIRGVDGSHIVRALMDKRLVRVTGRSEEMGRPVLYGTTPEFLEVFNLANIDELPPEHELEAMAETGFGKMGDIKTIVHNGDKEAFVFDEIDELDQLTEEIKNISAETEFTQSLKVEEKKRISNSGEEVKSAFDLLEEYLDEALIKQHNAAAASSELFTAVTLPDVISDLTAGPFNVPEEDDDDFEMIDLDTGEAIHIEMEADDSDELEALEEEGGEVLFNLDGDETPEEVAKNLSEALDKAFETLTGEKLDIAPLDALEEDEEGLNNELAAKEQRLEEVTNSMIDQADELDIDLSFLNEDNSAFDSDIDSLEENREE